MREKIINILYRNRLLIWLIPIFHRIIGKSRIVICRRNKGIFHNSILYKTKMDLGKGHNNMITVGENSFISNSNIMIKGSDNQIVIGNNGFINGLQLTLEGDNNFVFIGDAVFILDDTRIIVVDGSKLSFGRECMLSDHIDIRTTDNHSIIDRSTKKRINYEEDIVIGNNVWIGTGVNVLKGTILPSGTIVGARSVVTRRFDKENCVIVGNPAKQIKSNVD